MRVLCCEGGGRWHCVAGAGGIVRVSGVWGGQGYCAEGRGALGCIVLRVGRGGCNYCVAGCGGAGCGYCVAGG